MADGIGRPLESSGSEPWQELANELTPAKSLVRTADSAKFVVATVAVVGGVLTGFGVVGADRLGASELGSAFSLVALVAVVAALAFALLFLRLRTGEINIENLVEVRTWYKEQAGRSWMVTAAGALLVVAIAAAGAAASATVVDHQAHGPEVVLVQTRKSATTWTVSGSVTCRSCRRGSKYTILLYDLPSTERGFRPGSSTADVLLAVTAVTDSDGAFAVTLPVAAVGIGTQVSLMVDQRTYTPPGAH
jgi:hypothetical protein